MGNSEYEVTIALPIDLGVFTCTCPYAKEGNYCKHMAALMYYLEVRDLISESKESEEGEEVMTNIEQISQIPQIIAKIPRTDLEKLLLEQIKKGLLDYQVLFLLADNFSLDDFITEIEHFINLWVKSAPREKLKKNFIPETIILGNMSPMKRLAHIILIELNVCRRNLSLL